MLRFTKGIVFNKLLKTPGLRFPLLIIRHLKIDEIHPKIMGRNIIINPKNDVTVAAIVDDETKIKYRIKRKYMKLIPIMI